jgi:ferritin-like metal-binding protein YciE
MAANGQMNERDMKLVQWLNEAYAKEAELEADLNAHIRLTQKASYKKRLQQHLKETRDHKKRVAQRIKKLGGSPVSVDLPGVPDTVGEVAGKAVAALKGQVGAARAAITEQAETHVRNAQGELREEHVEIAIYTRIETMAQEVGDRDTAQLAKEIRRDEERMAKFLEAELKRLVKDVVRAEIPRNQRATTSRRTTSRRTTARKRTTASSASRGRSPAKASASRTSSRTSTTTRAGSSRAGTGKAASAKSGTAKATTAKATTAKASGTRRSTTKASGTRRTPAGSGSRSRS